MGEVRGTNVNMIEKGRNTKTQQIYTTNNILTPTTAFTHSMSKDSR